MIKIAPSILSADFAKLGEEIEMLDRSVCDIIHFDVMDGHFVPNITIGPMIVDSVRKRSNKIFDVHLMMTDPLSLVDQYIDAGADIITIHPESIFHLHRAIQYLKTKKVCVGVALNPSTSIDVLKYVLEDINMVLLMTVNPGFGGQRFIPSMIEKIRDMKSKIVERGLNVDIEVDGGINLDNVSEIVKAGANILVAGSFVFSSPNPSDTISSIKKAAEEAFLKRERL